jgi:GNAT superfamily N-acetyltransferase
VQPQDFEDMMQGGTPLMLTNAMEAIDGQPVNNAIALAAAIIALCSVGVAIFVYWRTEQRERRIEKSTAYLELEVNSSEAFRYQAQHAAVMERLRRWERPDAVPLPESEAWETTLNYYFQCLNLFEVCANFRRNRIIQPQVFASWVAWFFDLLKDWYFRSIWDSELRSNYTRDVRNIFDLGTAIFQDHPEPEVREREFYKAVAYLMGDCPTIANWLDEISEAPVWPPRERGAFSFLRRIDYAPRPVVASETPAEPARAVLNLRWNGDGDAALAAAFAGDIISRDTAYISHGEIQTGLSPDGKAWVPNLGEIYADDFSDLDGRDLLVVRDDQGVIVAVAVLAWEESRRRRYAVLEDMAVDPARRSDGIGAQVLEAVASRVADQGVEWLFLESGLRNRRAHAFFERHGFHEISHVFGRRIEPPDGSEPGR